MNVIERIAVWHKKLCEEPDYSQYLTALDDASAVEGSLYADTQIAAAVVRQAAAEDGDGQLGGLPLDTIIRELAQLIERPIDFDRMAREALAERMARARQQGRMRPRLN